MYLRCCTKRQKSTEQSSDRGKWRNIEVWMDTSATLHCTEASTLCALVMPMATLPSWVTY
eukprot:3647497-Amphidinium_carterae.1